MAITVVNVIVTFAQCSPPPALWEMGSRLQVLEPRRCRGYHEGVNHLLERQKGAPDTSGERRDGGLLAIALQLDVMVMVMALKRLRALTEGGLGGPRGFDDYLTSFTVPRHSGWHAPAADKVQYREFGAVDTG